MICLTPKPSESFFIYCIQIKKKFFTEKVLFKEKEELRIEQKNKNKNKRRLFLTVLASSIKKDPTSSLRKYINELKVRVETVRTAIKRDLSLDINPLVYALWGVLENKTSTTSYSNIGFRLVLKKNGIKYLKNLFWRHENRFVLVQ